MSKILRKVKSIRIYVEGKTEENYLNELKKDPCTKFNIKPINIKGGGYSSFIKAMNKDSHLGYIATFIFIDLDKADSEAKQLRELIDYCYTESKYQSHPYILIGTNKNFEFFACCHSPNYNKGDTKAFIEKELGYRDLSRFKSDSYIYSFLNKDSRSYNVALEKLSKDMKYINYKDHIKQKEKGLDITISLNKKPEIDEVALQNQHSNITDFFRILNL